jgi:aromatic-L-amino-acid/L-tryptophan decarboxylase
MTPDERSPLALGAEEMRRQGYRTVDMLVDRLTGPPGHVVRRATPAEMRERLAMEPPEHAAPFEQVLADLERDVLPFVARLNHPGYLAFIPGEGTWPGALGDLISSALNVDTCWWLGSAGPSALELAVLDWFKAWVGYPNTAAGVLVSGGSAANLTALACARETLLGPMTGDVVAYMSDQTHSSLARAARVLGFRPDQVRVIASDQRMRMRPDSLNAAIRHDREAGRRPLVVVANAGSTGAGAVDPFAELAAVCHEHGAWLHVDGAYGGFACLTERGRTALAGMELADSISLDPHKWLYQPIEVGALLVRDGEVMRRAFEITPDYLTEVETPAREVNFSDLGIQLTRACRALKLWMSLRTFGVAAFREAIDRCFDLVAHAERRIEASAELELITPASLGVVTFRRRPPGMDDHIALERLNTDLVAGVESDREVFLSTARVAGRLAVRMCVLNHSTTQAEVDRAIELIATLPADSATVSPAAADRGGDVEAGWLGRPQLDAEALRLIPLMTSLAPTEAKHVVRSARERFVLEGERVVEQWASSRDLFVVLSGRVAVRADGRHIATLGPGDFFGEMAALDWGASYGRVRTADVAATAPTRLLVLDWELVQSMMRSAPEVAALLEQTARARLAAL